MGKGNDYNYINFRILDSIKLLEKEIEAYRNKKCIWEKKQYKGGKQGYSANDIISFCNYHKN